MMAAADLEPLQATEEAQRRVREAEAAVAAGDGVTGAEMAHLMASRFEAMLKRR